MSSALRDCEANILSSVNSMEECAAPLVSDAFSRVPVNGDCVCVCVCVCVEKSHLIYVSIQVISRAVTFH